jgi:hypothetical protein
MDYGMDGQGSIPGRGNIFFSPIEYRQALGADPASYPMLTGCSFRKSKSGWGVRLATHLYVVPKSRMVMYIHNPYIFVACSSIN